MPRMSQVVGSDKCFSILDHATTKYQVKIKEALRLHWEQATLNKQLYHVNLTLSVFKIYFSVVTWL